jgi:aminoglycoside 2'-N-acetyltransferase I
MVLLVRRTGEMAPEMLAAVRGLLLAAFAGDFSDDDWDHTLGGWHVVAVDGASAPLAHAAVVERRIDVGDRSLRTGYVEAVATLPSRQGTGWGSAVMGEIGALVQAHFELGALATGVHRFYERLGWERWRGPAHVRRDGEAVRIPEEDDAIMVLRCPATAELDLTLPICCEDRPGAAW